MLVKPFHPMEIAQGLVVPIKPEYVLTPKVYYADKLTGIYFTTEDDQFGRITFENLDAIKISRGEIIPYNEETETISWILKVNHSKWLAERYDYEKRVYGSSYEFGGNVDEMLTAFNHYVFRFHDQFIEVIAKGFWYEKSEENLFGKELMSGHPFLPLTQNNVKKIESHGLVCQVRINTTSMETLKNNANFCSQPLMEFALELDGDTSVNHTLVLSSRNNKLITTLRGYFGKNEKEIEGVGSLEDVRPEIEQYMKEVYERRRTMGK